MLKNKKTLGIVCTLLGGILWGFSGCCGQFLFKYKEATATWLVPIRLTVAGLMLLIYYLFKKENVFSVFKTKKSTINLIVFALLGMMLCQFAYFITIQYTDAGTATVMEYLGPVFILLYTCLKNKRKPTLIEIIAILLAISGTTVLATHFNFTKLSLPIPALIFGMLAAISMAAYNISSENLMKKHPTLLIMGWGMFIGGIVLLIVFQPWEISIVFDLEALLCLAGVILIGTIAAFYLYLTGVKYVGSVTAGLIACIEPVAATIISVFWLNQAFSFWDIIGFVLIMLTVVIVSLQPAIKSKKKST